MLPGPNPNIAGCLKSPASTHALFDGTSIVGWIATGPTLVKTANLVHSPFVSVNYWDQQQDIATAECRATWHHDDTTCTRVWNTFRDAAEPVGYDPAIIPQWNDPTDAAFAVLRLDPWRLRVFPGSALLTGEGDILDWHA